MGSLLLVLGGARGGKSRFALDWAAAEAARLGGRALFVATAQPFDDEMQERIARHRQERPPHWGTLEAPSAVAPAVGAALRDAEAAGTPYAVVVVDCLTLLASNVLLALPEEAAQEDVTRAVVDEVDALLAVQAQSPAAWVIVSNEVGMGIVPPSRLGRLYRDALGRANQRAAAAAGEVILMVAGLPWQLKPAGAPGHSTRTPATEQVSQESS